MFDYDYTYHTDLSERITETLQRTLDERITSEAIYTALDALAIEIDTLAALNNGWWQITASVENVPGRVDFLTRWLRRDMRFTQVGLIWSTWDTAIVVFKWALPPAIVREWDLPL